MDDLSWFDYGFIIDAVKGSRDLAYKLYPEAETEGTDSLIERLEKLQDKRIKELR
jgi:hypothetical protein